MKLLQRLSERSLIFRIFGLVLSWRLRKHLHAQENVFINSYLESVLEGKDSKISQINLSTLVSLITTWIKYEWTQLLLLHWAFVFLLLRMSGRQNVTFSPQSLSKDFSFTRGGKWSRGRAEHHIFTQSSWLCSHQGLGCKIQGMKATDRYGSWLIAKSPICGCWKRQTPLRNRGNLCALNNNNNNHN